MNSAQSRRRPMATATRTLLILAAMSLLLPVCEVAFADSTPSAPTHGYRKKNKLERDDNKGNRRKTRMVATEDYPAEDRKSMLADTSRTVGTAASELIAQAMDLVGIPYKFGGKAPNTGFDCSGFVNHVFREAAGVILPRKAAQMSLVGQKVSHKELQPGDLVFYNTLKRAVSHVGIYIGDNKFIHSPKRGGVVEIADMNRRYWRTRYQGARRVAMLEQGTETASQAVEPTDSNITESAAYASELASSNPNDNVAYRVIATRTF